MVNKKGLSDIVTTVFIIVLVIVAIVLMWAFIRPAIDRAGSTVGTLGYSVGLSIVEDSVIYPGTAGSALTFRVTRNADQGNMAAINVVAEDATGASKVIKIPSTLGELGTETITLTSENLTGLGVVTKISVSPVLLTEEGVEFNAPVSDEETVGVTTPSGPPGSFTLTTALSGTGSGTITGTGISCPGDCTQSYTTSTSVTLTATPAAGSTFTAWAGVGSCLAPAACTFTISSSMTVTATFTTGTITQCNDGIDNEAISGGGPSGSGGGDGWIDAEDPGCWTNPTSPSTYSASDNSESFVGTGNCANQGESVDLDSVMDGYDDGCIDALDTSEVSQCEDSADNDGDTKIDNGSDYGCSSLTDNSELSAAECYETDSGQTPGTAGTTSLYTGLPPPSSVQSDVCITSTQVREFYCNPAHTAILNSSMTCTTTCSAGACTIVH